MLDDLKLIHQRDKSDALGICAKQPDQLLHNFEIKNWQPEIEKVEKVVVAGMGGSALAASFITTSPGLSLPLEIVRNYELPDYVDDKTLFIASSYSGNTEETLSALAQARSHKARIVIIASGGELARIAQERKYPLLEIPTGFQPRYAVFYNYAALVTLLQAAKLIDAKSLKTLRDTAKWLKKEIANWQPEMATGKNLAKQLALDLVGSSIVVYSGPKLFPAAYKWKINFNENAKHIAWCGQYPEFNHNEFLGWTKQPVDKPYKVIEIRSNLEHERIQKRFQISEKLLSGMRPYPEAVVPKGSNILKQLLWTVQLGDFASLYLALLNNLDPTPVDMIEKLKKELK